MNFQQLISYRDQLPHELFIGFSLAILLMNVGEYSEFSGLQMTSGTRQWGLVFLVSEAHITQMTFRIETRVQLYSFG